jgi:hypothetical protein
LDCVRPCGVGAPLKNVTFWKAGDDGLYVVRLSAVIAMVFVASIWLGLYLNGSEWPWQYTFLVLLMGFLAFHAAGRSLGTGRAVAVGPLGRPLAAGVPAGLLSTKACPERGDLWAVSPPGRLGCNRPRPAGEDIHGSILPRRAR